MNKASFCSELEMQDESEDNLNVVTFSHSIYDVNEDEAQDRTQSRTGTSSCGKSMRLIDSGFLKKRKLSSAFFPVKNSKYEEIGDLPPKEIEFEEVVLTVEEEKPTVTPSILNLVDDDIINETCLMCNLSLSTLTETEKEDHLNQCLDDQGIERSQNKSSDCTERGLRCSEFFCVICDVNLSKRKLLDRCLHLKRCAKDHQMSTKQLMQFISPDFENEAEQLEMQDNDDEFIEEIIVPPVIGSAKKSGEVINLLSESEEEEEGSQGLQRSLTVPARKNALSMLMESSRHQTNLAKTSGSGGFEPVAKKSHTVSAPSSVKPRPMKAKVPNDKGVGVSPATGEVDPAVTNPSAAPKTSRFNRWNRNNNNQRFGGASKGPGGSGNYAPAYKKVQVGEMSYPIIVDGFQFASSLLSDCYFLTHFHSDHYTGLTQDFSCGNIYCTPTTGSLVKLKLKVATKHLIPLELEKKYTISVGGVDVEVMLTDANHCPGAACIYFKFPNGKIIFHTGDFRWTDNLLRGSPLLRSIQSGSNSSNMRNLTVYLDTTYCDPNYDFPHQDAAINSVIDCVREENKIPGALFVFGAYAIGKERVFMAVAEELNGKVYVDNTRYRSMCCYDWSMQEKARLTTDPSKSNIWVVGMNQINFNQLLTLKKKKSGGCTRVVAFQPTGWSFTSKSNVIYPELSKILEKYPFLHVRKKEGNTIYSLPYSEHSSFGELISFIRLFRPGRVIPTVNTSKEQVDQQIQLLKDKSGVYGPGGENQSSNNNNTNNNNSNQNSAGDSSYERKYPQTVQPPSSSSFEDLFSSETTNSIFF